MSVMFSKKKFGWWVGGASSIQVFFWDFWNFFNFANPIRYYCQHWPVWYIIHVDLVEIRLEYLKPNISFTKNEKHLKNHGSMFPSPK